MITYIFWSAGLTADLVTATEITFCMVTSETRIGMRQNAMCRTDVKIPGKFAGLHSVTHIFSPVIGDVFYFSRLRFRVSVDHDSLSQTSSQQ